MNVFELLRRKMEGERGQRSERGFVCSQKPSRHVLWLGILGGEVASRSSWMLG